MTIIVEDGSVVSGSNSYNSDAEYTSYAAARGITIGADLAAREIELIRSTDYVDNYLIRFKLKTDATQSLRYPQSTSYANGVLVPSDVIPNELKRAQLEAAISVFKGDLDVTETASNIKSEQLGTLKTEYFEGSSSTVVSSIKSDEYLDMLSVTMKSGMNFGEVFKV